MTTIIDFTDQKQLDKFLENRRAQYTNSKIINNNVPNIERKRERIKS